MRTTLPTKFAELTLVSTVGDQTVETVGNFLIQRISDHQVTAINVGGETIDYLHYEGIIDRHPRVANITFLSDEDDDYQEFVIGIQYSDMVRAIENLADHVKAEFDTISSVCPIDLNSLLEMLGTRVLNYIKTRS